MSAADPAPLLAAARTLLVAQTRDAAAKLAGDLLAHVGAVADSAPLIRAALALLESTAALGSALRVVKPGDERRRAAGA